MLAALFFSILLADADGGFAKLIGTWSCGTAAQSSVSMSFAQNADGSVSLDAPWSNRGIKGRFLHTFTQNADGTWVAASHSLDNAIRFTGRSPGFANDEITFTGMLKIANGPDSISGIQSYPERERFNLLSTGRLEHVWEQSATGNDPWNPVSYAVCSKT